MLEHLWVVFTIIAAASQTMRNALQRDLVGVVGTVGATHARFLYGMPFGLLFLGIIAQATDTKAFFPSLAFLAWTTLGAVAQILATALMLAAMKSRSFLVTIAYTKTETVLIVVFGLIFLGEVPTAPLLAAVAVATIGVMIMSWPKQGAASGAVRSWRPAFMGIAAGGLFGLAAVGFKGGIQSLALPSFVMAAATTLAVALAIQTSILTLYLLVTDRSALVKLARAWKPSLSAGFLGAFASQMWFLGFALEPVAHVRTLGLVEILFSLAVSRKLFAQVTSPREGTGIALLVIGVIVVLNT